VPSATLPVSTQQQKVRALVSVPAAKSVRLSTPPSRIRRGVAKKAGEDQRGAGDKAGRARRARHGQPNRTKSGRGEVGPAFMKPV
jgi:hypothetical protein